MLLGHHRCGTGTCGGHVVQVACCRRPVCSICDSDWYCHKCGLCKQVMCTMLWGVLKAVSAGRCLCFRSNPFNSCCTDKHCGSTPRRQPQSLTGSVYKPTLACRLAVSTGEGVDMPCVSCAIHSLPTSCPPTVLLHQDSTSAAVQARQALA